MTDKPQISRRALLRLPNADPSRELLGAAPTGALQPIAEPPNHDGLDTSQLPPVREALLSSAQVAALFADIERYACDVQFTARRAAAAPSAPPPMREIGQKLLAGEIDKLQIRYRWQETLWIDTLERKADGVRLVRIGHA